MLMMKCCLIALLVAVGAEGSIPSIHQNHPTTGFEYTPLFSKYDTEATKRLKTRHGHAAAPVRPSPALKASLRSVASGCQFSFNLLILQDATGSFNSDWFSQVSSGLRTTLNSFEGSTTTYSIVSFQDKPINELGETTDSCYVVDLLQSTDITETTETYVRINPGGGWDWPENQFGALQAVVSSNSTIPWINKDAVNLVVLITDSGPHYDGDNYQTDYSQLASYPGTFDQNDYDSYCTSYYYPPPEDVISAVATSGVYFAAIVTEADQFNGLALRSWQWFNEVLGQPSLFVTSVDSNADFDFISLQPFIEEIISQICGDLTSTTTTTTTTTTSETTETTVDVSSEAAPSDTTEEESSSAAAGSTTATATTTAAAASETGGTETAEAESTAEVASSVVASSSAATIASSSAATEEASISIVETGASTEVTNESENTTPACVCPGSTCCKKNPEVQFAFMKRPQLLDIHMEA